MSKSDESKFLDGKKVLFKVAASSNVSKIAGAIAKHLEDGLDVELVAIGAGAVNQSVKAIAAARALTAPSGKNLCCVPAFRTENTESESKTSIHLIIYDMRF